MSLSNEAILTECPNPNSLVFSATWYHLTDCVNFTICSRCFEDHIRQTSFASRFQAERLAPKPDRTCLFNTERMRLLWSSLQTNNGWDSIHRYMLHREKIPNCQKKEGVKAGGPGSDQWYKFRNGEIPDFACCVACYEDIICATPFADRFVLSPSGLDGNNNKGQVVMICDLSVKFIYRALLEQSPRHDWNTFTTWAAARLKLPACMSLKSLKCSSTTWYMPNPPLYGVFVCGACFHDGADLTPMAGSFLQVQIPPEKSDEAWECANSTSVLPMAVAWSTACNRKNFSLWYNTARTITNYPPCTKDGIHNRIWYSMSGCPEFRICSRCFIGIVQSQGDVIARHFHQSQSTDGSAYICDFFINKNKRTLRYFEKIDEAVTLANGQIFHDFIARVSPQPICPTDGTSRNRRWYCSSDDDGGTTICESCYEEAIRGTALANRLTLRERADECFCDAYSPRMRGIWNQACASNDMTVFGRALKERMQIYAITVPRMRTILEIAKMRMNTQSTLMLSSVMLQGADNIVSASRPAGMHHGMYGNSQIGYHWETAAGAQGEMQFRQATSMGIAATGDMAEMAQLGALWRQYE